MAFRRTRIFRLIATATVALVIATMLTVARVFDLLFPSRHFPFNERYGIFSIYSDVPVDNPQRSALRDAENRLLRHYPNIRERYFNLYLCSKKELYELLAQQIGHSGASQGFHAHPLGRTFISTAFVKDIARRYGEGWQGTLLEGSLAHVVSHEIVHQLMAEAQGFIQSRQIARWKSEGYAEYISAFWSDTNKIAAIDSLRNRLHRYGHTLHPIRRHYIESQFIVAYLTEIRKMSLEQIFAIDKSRKALLLELLAAENNQ